MRVDATSYRESTSRIIGWARAAESRYVCCASVNNVMEAFDSSSFRRVMNQADLVTPDGMPLVWGLRLLGARNATRVYGPDLTLRTLAVARLTELPVGFYGGSPLALNRLLDFARREFPGLTIAYAYSPPFRELTPAEDADLTREILESGARILFVGLSTPKQEIWMAAHRGRVPAVMLGVGAAFDFLAGLKPQAPVWMRHAGLEWLFRLFSEPRRLAPRYLRHNPRFLAFFTLQLLKLREHW